MIRAENNDRCKSSEKNGIKNVTTVRKKLGKICKNLVLYLEIEYGLAGRENVTKTKQNKINAIYAHNKGF